MRRRSLIFLLLMICFISIGTTSADLPESVNAKLQYPYSSAYFGVTINSQIPAGGDLRIGDPPYPGWCVESQHQISAVSYDFRVYSSLNPSSMPDNLRDTINWSAINYIINHKAIANDNITAIQAAIWKYDGGVALAYKSWATGSDYNAILAATEANAGPDWRPGPLQKYAVVLHKEPTIDPITQKITYYQTAIIEVPLPDIPVPEFSSALIPFALIIGILGLVYHSRSRNS